MKKQIKFIFRILFSVILYILIWAITITTVKNIQKVILVEEFKNRATLNEEISSKYIKYYKIESNEDRPTFINYGNDCLPGNSADILVTTQALVFKGMPIIGDIIPAGVSFFAGGHAAIINDTWRDYYYGSAGLDTTVEATGLNEGENPATIFNRSYWVDSSTYTEVIVLRCKLNEEQVRKVNALALSYVGDPYNYSFIFDTINKTYCSDLVSKVFNELGYNLNKDGFATTIYDLIVSNDCYISYYHYFDSDNVKHVYYLD